MAIINEDSIKNDTLKEIAKKMLVSARTAPKGRGDDNFEFLLVDGDTIKDISEKMKDIGEKHQHPAFIRDAVSILSSPVILLLGARIKPLGLKKCGMCGFKNCEEKDQHKKIPCVFNTGDLGIAIGSAVSVAMDNRVDNRIMYTVGQAVMEMNIMSNDIKVAYAIPLSASSKNPFFDRK